LWEDGQGESAVESKKKVGELGEFSRGRLSTGRTEFPTGEGNRVTFITEGQAKKNEDRTRSRGALGSRESGLEKKLSGQRREGSEKGRGKQGGGML